LMLAAIAITPMAYRAARRVRLFTRMARAGATMSSLRACWSRSRAARSVRVTFRAAGAGSGCRSWVVLLPGA
jgi:hypothetical protein